MSDQAPMPSRKTAPNVRLVDPLKTQAAAKAKDLGISLNALVALAVRQYLDGGMPHHQHIEPDSARSPLAPASALRAALGHTAPSAAPRHVPGGTIGPGRGAALRARPTKKAIPEASSSRYVLRRHGGEVRGLPCPRMTVFLLCPLRVMPSGILGASFQSEYVAAESFVERLWQSTRSQGDF